MRNSHMTSNVFHSESTCGFMSRGFKSLKSSLSSCWGWFSFTMCRCCQSGCFPDLKIIWKKHKDLIKLTIKISMHIVFNLILSGIDVGTDIVAAMNHFR